MAKNKINESRDIRETVWTTPYFFPCKVCQSHFQKIGKFKQISPGESQNIREIKTRVYGKRQTSDSRFRFLKINDTYTRMVQNNSYVYG